MLSTTESTLRDLFNRLGNNAVKIILHKNAPIITLQIQVERVKKAKDYAFVHFSSRDAAEHALAASKGLVIDEADVSCFITLEVEGWWWWWGGSVSPL